MQQRESTTGEGTVGRRVRQSNGRFLAWTRTLPPSIVPLRDGGEAEVSSTITSSASRSRSPAIERSDPFGDGSWLPGTLATLSGSGCRGRLPQQIGFIYGSVASASSTDTRRTETAAQLHRSDRHGYPVFPGKEAGPLGHLSAHPRTLPLLSYPWSRLEKLHQAQFIAERLLRQVRQKRQRQGSLLGDSPCQSRRLSPRRLQKTQGSKKSS